MLRKIFNFIEIKPWFCLCTFRDELPIKLALPKAIRSAQTNQELTAIALQGQGNVVSVCLFVYLTQSFAPHNAHSQWRIQEFPEEGRQP